ncbi:hypothetical protein C5167_048516 [Papaver somniferum]|uniref:Cytochrome P450 n=1 Tax=Papaver somniferum TaxID=3469 RepID=A0A4Y7KL34_PAPSO|nr:hypothetical protein C5167_048516 [Papaver somniferum]
MVHESGLLMAATDTISATVEWALAELLHNPSKMTKAQQELLNIIGKDRPIEESDIIRLPYLQAIVKETLRLHPPAPFLLPHKAEVDVKIHDFVVPKDTQSFDWKLENGMKPEDMNMEDGSGFTLVKATGLRVLPALFFG